MVTILSTTVELGKWVREIRKAQGLTQEDVAGITGTGRRFISDLESGKPTIQLGKVLLVLNAIGAALTVSTQWKA
jgi:y4mF family transcriptional regulator